MAPTRAVDVTGRFNVRGIVRPRGRSHSPLLLVEGSCGPDPGGRCDRGGCTCAGLADLVVAAAGRSYKSAGVPGEKWRTDVTIRFSAVDGDRTKVEIEEGGWDDSEAGRKASYGNCMGWSQMLCALKAWVEHGINLREGAYR